MPMDELENQFTAEAAAVRARAAAVAQTETALGELHAAGGRRDLRSPWTSRAVAATSIAAAAVVGFVILRQNDSPQSVSSAGGTNPTITTVFTPAGAAPTTTMIEPTATADQTTDATLSTSTPFTRCDYTDPGQYPSTRICPDSTAVAVSNPVTPLTPLVVGEPSSTMPEAIVSGVVALEGRCVYLIDSVGGATRVIVWPAGTSWDSRRTEIVLPDGQRVDDGATIEGSGGYYAADNVPELDPAAVARVVACLPPGADPTTGDSVVRAFPSTVTPPTVIPLTPTS
jgi:hypothetical protein